MVSFKLSSIYSLVVVTLLSAANAAPGSNYPRQPIAGMDGSELLNPRQTNITRPIELLGFLSKGAMVQTSPDWPKVPYEFIIDYVAETMDPIVPGFGPKLLPTTTFSEANATQYDIILVPGGLGTRPQFLSQAVIDFVETQAPGLEYLLSVCTGSWVLARAGVLEGKNATTNKAAFKQVKAATSTGINWIPKARWVVDGTTWTSSGVSAGMDMAHGFLTHLVGPEFATKARNMTEMRTTTQDDDEFAEIYGLLDL